MINYFGIVIILFGIFFLVYPKARFAPVIKPRAIGFRYRFGPYPPYYDKLIRIGGVITIILGVLYFFGIINVGFS